MNDILVIVFIVPKRPPGFKDKVLIFKVRRELLL
jgi:hypothetical protein